MLPPSAARRGVRFGAFEVDFTAGELRKHGIRINLQDQPFRVLTALLERPGELITRDELRQHIWPADTFVDFDRSLNTAVLKLRQALGDSATHSRFLETVPKRGYRFLAAVEAIAPPAVPATQIPFPADRRRRGRVALLIASGITLLAAAGSLVYWTLRRRPTPETQAWNIVQLTSFPGEELWPSWSPDGRFIAFSRNDNLFVMPVNGGDPIQVTRGSDNQFPRWSPNGRYLAFLSAEDRTRRIYLMPPLGGARKLLADTNLDGLERFIDSQKALGGMPWSPDGREFLFSRLQSNGRMAVWKIDVETNRESPLTSPPAGCDDQLASWSFDGKWIAFTRRKDGNSDLWIMPAAGGNPQPLLEDVYDSERPAFSPDNRRVIFASNRAGPQNIWEIDIASRRLRPLTTGPATDAHPVASKSGGLLYSHLTYDLTLHRLNLGNGKDDQLTKNVGKNYQPRVSPDGNQVVYYCDRRSDFDIWLLDLRTNSERPIASDPATDVGPDWSPDGREVVFVSNRDGPFRLWIADVERGNARRLMEQPVIAPAGIGQGGAQRPGPRWSPDGRKIGFLAARDGHVFVCSMDLKTGSVSWLVSDVVGFDWYRDPVDWCTRERRRMARARPRCESGT